jgi:hypothetical protein
MAREESNGEGRGRGVRINRRREWEGGEWFGLRVTIEMTKRIGKEGTS